MSEYQTTNGPIVRTIQHDVGMGERKESSSAYTRPAGGGTSGTSSGTRDYVRIHNGSDITTGTMYGTMPTYYFYVQDFSENLEDFTEFGGGEQLRYLAPMSPGPDSPAPVTFTAPPQTRAYTVSRKGVRSLFRGLGSLHGWLLHRLIGFRT